MSLILPSPECDKIIATDENITALLKSADPWLNRDLSIRQLLVASTPREGKNLTPIWL